MRFGQMTGILATLAAALAAGTLSGVEKFALDGLWDFRFEKGKSLEEVSLPALPIPSLWAAMKHVKYHVGNELPVQVRCIIISFYI